MLQLVDQLTQDFAREGWLWKTGPRPTDAYKKRWFTLDYRKLMYHEEPLVRLRLKVKIHINLKFSRL